MGNIHQHHRYIIRPCQAARRRIQTLLEPRDEFLSRQPEQLGHPGLQIALADLVAGDNVVRLEQDWSPRLERLLRRKDTRELIQLGPGSVVTLDRRAGQPVELLLRGIPFALGKLVVVGEQLGVKVEQILSPEERESP